MIRAQDLSGESSYTTPNDREIVVTRVFDAPRARVFEAWTRAEHVARWWDPTGTPLAACEIDLRPAGAFRWVHRNPGGGEGYAFSGVYREILPPEKLVFTVRMFPSGPDPIGTLLFADHGQRTTLTLTITCATQQERDSLLSHGVEAGTLKTMENLAAYLAANLADIT